MCRTDGTAAVTADMNLLSLSGSPQRMRCTPGGTTPWDSAGKVTRPHPSPGPRRCSGWRGCPSSRSPPARLTAWPGPQFLLTGVNYRPWSCQGCRLSSPSTNRAGLLSFFPPQTTGGVAPALLRRPGGEHLLLPPEFSGELLRRYRE